MRHFLRDLIALLMMAVTATFAPVAFADERATRLMAFACSAMQYDCRGIPPPTVVYDPTLYRLYQIWGAYDPDGWPNHIWVDNLILPQVSAIAFEAVIAHEITHYLDHKLGYMPAELTRDALCGTEARGWRVYNAYVHYMGRPDMADTTWQVRYGC